MKDRVEAYMNQVSEKIRKAEEDLECVWFDFEEEPLAWAIDDRTGTRRILLGDKPLIEHKFEIREKYLSNVRSLVMFALDEAEQRMDAVGNVE